MIGSTLSYIALRWLGKGLYDGENREMERARKWILDHSGATVIPSWGKIYLLVKLTKHGSLECMNGQDATVQVLGVYEWSGCNPVPLEFWLFPSFLPFYSEDPNGDEFKYHLARVPDFLWLEEDGMKMQATKASNLIDEYGDALQRAHFYIKESQIKENLAGDFKKMYRHFTKGTWTFSDQDQSWAVSNCTAEALKEKKWMLKLIE
ncbi:hypothetical protein C3L33_15940, partial [Rhododendron williamsianum]